MASTSKTTTNHNEIRKWAEARGGRPVTVRGTGKKDEPGRPLLYGTSKEFLDLFNLRDLMGQPGVVLAVVPSDLLDFLAASAEDPELRRTKDALRVVFPLYEEEVHVLARPGIATFADLAGKRVAVGDPDSGTLVTATLLLAVDSSKIE